MENNEFESENRDNSENQLYFPRCQFCGKQMIAVDEIITNEEEASHYAKMHCDCELAKDYQRQVEAEEKRKENVDKIRNAVKKFAEYCQRRNDIFRKDIEDILIDAGMAVLNGYIDCITIKIYRVKIQIKLNGRGSLQFKSSFSEHVENTVL